MIKEKYWQFYHDVNKLIKYYKEHPNLPCKHEDDLHAQCWGVAHDVFEIDKLGYY